MKRFRHWVGGRVETHSEQLRRLEQAAAAQNKTMSLDQLRSLRPRLRRPLIVYDVGARWGAYPEWDVLEDRVRIVGFEADAAECERLNKEASPNVTYIPVALGRDTSSAVLFITQEPACSSLYPPRALLADRSRPLNIIRQVGAVDVELIPLDNWIENSGELAPDVLKLDTQGSELDILIGATEALKTVELIDVEVEFNPIYEGQPLFSQVDAHLRSAGFELWRLGPLVHYSADIVQNRGQTGLEVIFDIQPAAATAFGSGQLFWAQAYYTKEDVGVGGDSRLSHDRGLRIAAGAFGLGLYDLAELALARIDTG